MRELDIPADCIRGNGDRETLAACSGRVGDAVPGYFHDAMLWNARQLGEADQRSISVWPLTVRQHIPGLGDVLFCHATPRDDNEIFTRTTDAARLLPIVEPLNVAMVVCGHVHMQFDRVIGRTRVVNAGSVGMPFQDPGAYWLLLGPDVRLCRTSYDLDAAARSLLAPPSEASMIELFAKAELT